MINEEYIDNLGKLSTKEYIKRKESYEDKYDNLVAKLYEYGTYDDDLRSAAYETIVMHGGGASNVDIVELKQLLDEYNEADIKFKEAREKHRRNMKMIEKIKRYGGSNGDDDYYDYGGDDDDDYYDYGGDDDYYDYGGDDDYYDYGGDDDYYDYYSSDDDYYSSDDDYYDCDDEEKGEKESKKEEKEKDDEEDEFKKLKQKLQKAEQLLEEIDQQGEQKLSEKLRQEILKTLIELGKNLNPNQKISDKDLIHMLGKEKRALVDKMRNLKKQQQEQSPTIQTQEQSKLVLEQEKHQEQKQGQRTTTQTTQSPQVQLKQSTTKPRPAPPPRKKTVPTRKQTISDTDDIIKTKVKLYEKLIKHLKLLNDVYNESSFDDDIKNKYDDIEFNDSQQHSDDLQDLIDMFESGPNKHDESDEYEGIPDEILDEYYDDIRKLIKYEGLNINAINTAYNDHRDDFIEKLINGDNDVPQDYPKDIPIKTKYLIKGKQSTDQQRQQSTRGKQLIVRRKEQQQSTRREQSQRGRGRGRGIGQPSTQVKPTGRRQFPPKQPTSTPPQSSSQSTTRQSIPKQPPQKTGGF